MIKSWSPTRLQSFQTCKRMAWLKYDQRIPEPERPLPPGKTEHANDRGTRVHDNAEHYVRGNIGELCAEAAKHFGVHIDLLRILYKDGLVSLEGEWGMNDEWEPCDYNGEWKELATADPALPKVKTLPERGKAGQRVQVGKKFYEWVPVWLRLKLDALVFHDKKNATVIDYKTGRKFGNEVKHAEQIQLYQLVTFLRYPELETVTTELWYLDQNEVTRQTFTRAQGLRFKTNFDRRGREMTTATEFPHNANVFSCQWCMYGPWGTGHCQDGVKKGFNK